ncbi:MAG: DNA-directed RNA polymerase subunit beta' [Clostridiales bacterium]|nr:DNA-directed RNA polymerase subunit beta' [Clostridiales bacterium]
MSCPDFDAVKISIASPEQIRAWSYGEVKKPETINYRTLKPERDGLFCERIFGPTKDWECHCGKYKKIRYKGKICDRCGVEVTRSKVRRERMGHIELAAPVSHIWYFKGIPSRMGLILDISPRVLEKVLYFVAYIVTDPGNTPLAKNQILSEKEYRDMREKYEDDFDAGMGTEAVKKLLEDIDLQELYDSLMADLKNASGQKKARIVKRLEVVGAFLHSGNRPEWMIIEALPVIPPDIRPMIQLDGGRFATSDLNDLYRRVINRNNRLKRLQALRAPEIIVRNEKRMLQEAVDALIDNGRRGRAVTGANNRALKSLSDFLKGKQGRFRQNLLGKRVDYSGRSVIVVGPELKIYQMGLPKEMAVELFRPFIMKKLVQDGVANNIKSAKKMVDKGRPEVWDALEFVIKDHPVMMNRAPTLHRLSIQAFEPVLVEGRAMKLHPLVCTPFNADFDGDQMAVHVPLSAEAQAEARVLMLSANNLLRPQDGGPVTTPSQDMVLGSYYLTYEKDPLVQEDKCFETCADAVAAMDAGSITGDEKIWVRDTDEKRYQPWIATNALLCQDALNEGAALPREIYKCFASDTEARLAYEEGLLRRPKMLHTTIDQTDPVNWDDLDIHEPILVRRTGELNGKTVTRMVRTTVGRLIFNDQIPQDLGFVDRTDPEHFLDPEINSICGKKLLGKIISACIKQHGFADSAVMLDGIKAQGYHYSTIGSLTVSIYDMTIPQAKYALVAASEKQVVKIERQFRRGLLTDDERYRLVVREWEKTTKDVSDALTESMDQYNPIFMMADSGARGSQAQIRQLAGMRGLLANTAGKTIEIPVKANYREGLSVLEYFTSSRGARKGMSDTALRTADSGYLTRRLVDVSQEVIVREEDCGTDDGIMVYEIAENGQVIETFAERINGRYLCEPLCDPETGEVLHNPKTGRTYDTETIVFAEDAEFLEAHGIKQAKVRSVLTCHARRGVCSKCYGLNLALQERVGIGEAVGIIAAQSIGEPGTQLTMRTFHTGGVAGGDITQGLPRVEELFEARRPKKMAQLAEISGKCTIGEQHKGTLVSVTLTADDGDTRTYMLPQAQLLVKNGDFVAKGTQLVPGALYPQDVLRIQGIHALHEYLVKEVLKPYRSQGVDINDKHIEVICRQMMRRVQVDDAGDSDLLSGSNISLASFEDARDAVQARIDAGEVHEDGTPLVMPTCTRLLLGITKAALATDSFLSAASFQETTKVLTEAAICGKVDPLTGLKENVIIGKLIPAGTGMDQFRCDDQISDDGNVVSQEEPADTAEEDLFVEEDAAPVEAVPVGSNATV